MKLKTLGLIRLYESLIAKSKIKIGGSAYNRFVFLKKKYQKQRIYYDKSSKI
jgi:hypothetical protein